MAKLFLEKRVSGALKVMPGTGTTVIDLPFVPEFIQVKFLDADHTRGVDSLDYDLVYIGDPLVKYQIAITWSVAGTKPRSFRYTVAKLASFRNGGL